jgi:uncharacterized membrane protein YhaH (DUF805 family)
VNDPNNKEVIFPRSLKDLYLSPAGRIGRRTFLIQGVLVFVVIGLVGSLLDSLVGANGIVSMIVSLLLIWPALCVQNKRWHDRDKSGWWVLIALVPVIGGIWAIVETGFLAGTSGPNRFGAPESGVSQRGAQGV